LSEKKVPTPEEIQKEFEDFVRSRFGGSVQVVTQTIGSDPAQHTPHESTPPEHKSPVDVYNFDMKPRDVKAHLDRFVIKQEDAKRALSIAVCDHYNQIARQRRHPEREFEYAKQNVLLLGPTGVGKTYLIKQIAKLIGVPFVKADATRFSETGYVGSNVDDLIKDLVSQAGGDIEAAQYGIIYLDEADKLASTPGLGRDVSGRGVQFGMLKLMEETEVDLTAGNDPRSQMQALMEMQRKGRIDRKVVNTRNILFIVSGAFGGLEDIIKRRLEHNSIGFGSGFNRDQQRGEIFRYASTQDFVEYGFEPEFIGRLPIRVACHHLDRNDLFDVLKNSEGSILRQYIDAFDDYGIRLSFEDAALAQISTLAEREKTGARALVTVCENVLRDYKFELPSSKIKELTVTPELVTDPAGVLAHLLTKPHGDFSLHQEQIDTYFDRYRANHRIALSLSPEGIRAVATEAAHRDMPIDDLLDELLSGYEHGLALIRQTTGQDSFTLGPTLVDQPKKTLERMVTECFRARAPHQGHDGAGGALTH
jgi:endopeptidase Clp ATP-binding regulatory subunit ClpX